MATTGAAVMMAVVVAVAAAVECHTDTMFLPVFGDGGFFLRFSSESETTMATMEKHGPMRLHS